jgi:adenosylcobinamide-phosphate synthase
MLHPIIFACAGILDEIIGDPEGWPHPVRAIGWIVSKIDLARSQVKSTLILYLLGSLLALALPTLAAASAWIVVRIFGRLDWIVEIFLGAWMLAGRSLQDAVRLVVEPLAVGNLVDARHKVSFVVGRDTDTLDEDSILRASLETLAEGLCDGVVSPLFWFAVGGLPALWAFKAVSTLDSMVGHHEHPWTHFGWASAKLDDLMNLLPSRISAVLIACAAVSMSALRSAWYDGSKTMSPNAGWVEAAFAGALGISLGGKNSYDGVVRHGPLLGRPCRSRDVAVLKEGLLLAGRVNRLALLIGTFVISLIYILT